MTPESVAHQVSLSMGFPRQEYWSELPFPSPGDLPESGIELGFPALWVDSLLLRSNCGWIHYTWEAYVCVCVCVCVCVYTHMYIYSNIFIHTYIYAVVFSSPKNF